MHFVKKLIILLIVFLFVTKANSSIYIVDNYSYTTSIKKIKKNRDKVIEDIKRKSLNDFIKSITISSDFNNLVKIKNYQKYFKLFIVKNEYKKNNSYELICKIEFDKSKIDSFFRNENIKYINYKSSPILTILINKKKDKLEIWSTDNFDNYLGRKFNNFLNTFPLNGDLTDIKLLNDIDPKSYQIARLDKITGNYGVRDFIFILFDYDKSTKKENVFVQSQFNELKTSKKFDLENFNEKELTNFFERLLNNLNNSWKEVQILAPQKNTNILFDYPLKKLSDYTIIKNVLTKNKMVLSLEDTEITNQMYSARIFFSGSLEQLKEYLFDAGFLFRRNGNKFYLTKK
tara:strand:- start:520 stop:1554 length:1035 start_codon:yes stop_codon:yes gene_type:complete